MDTPSHAAADAEPSHSAAGQVRSFLKRDIHTFRWWGTNGASSEGDNVPEPPRDALTAPDHDMPTEVDPALLEHLRFRRELLDWRDEFHFRVTECATQAKLALTTQIDQELSSLGFLRRRLFKLRATEVLADHIESTVRAPMRSTLEVQQATLDAHLQKWFQAPEPPPRCFVMFPKLEWDTRLSLKLTADNKERILDELHHLLLGPNGIADTHRQWATDHATQIEQRHLA